MKKQTAAFCLAALANAIFGFSFMFSDIAFEIVNPTVLLAVRFLVAFLVMNVLVLTKKFRFSLKGKPVWMLLALGLFQPILYFICENYGILYTSTAFSGTMIALIPVGSLVLSYLFLKEKVTRLQVGCAFLSVFGVILTTFGSEGGHVSLFGFLLLLGAVASACLYNITTKRATEYFNALEKTYVQFAVGSAAFVVLALFQAKGDFAARVLTPLSYGKFWIAIAYLAILSSVGAFLLLNYSIEYISVTQISILANLSTVISILAGILFLKEPFTLSQILGAAIIILSVYGVTREPKQKKTAAEI
ncbi:MAG: DMT family transporter [Lachnospiraceae bacterium]|nr:DMT family transporter [Lachnospiraceae bacterium]